MMEVKSTARIAASQEKVFGVFTDLRNAAGRIKGIKKLDVLTDGPIGKGTRFRETRIMFGKEATETMEITAFDPPRSYRVEANSRGAHYVSNLTFRPEGNETVAEMTFSCTPGTFVTKVMTALMGRMMMKACLKAMNADMADLKAAAEKTG